MRTVNRIAVVLALVALSPVGLGALPVDLTLSELRVARGFRQDSLATLPDPTDPDWARVRPTRGERPLMIRDLGVRGAGPWRPFDLTPDPVQEWTLVWPFEADLGLLNASDPAVFLSHVGQGWELYLNGQLLRDELERTGDGSLVRERSFRNVLVPIDKRALKQGTNILAIRIAGDPQNDRTGLNLSGPYLIDRYVRLRARTLEYPELMLAGVFFFFALYHILLFALRPAFKSYLAYGASTLSLAVYLVARSNVAVMAIGDSAIPRRVEYGALFVVVPLVVAFFDVVVRKKVSLFAWIYLGFAVALAAGAAFLQPEIFLYAWQLASVPAVIWVLGFDIAAPVMRSARLELAALDPKAFPGDRLLAFVRGAARSEGGQISIAVLLAAAASIADILIVNSGGSPRFTRWAFLVLVLGTGAVLARGQALAVARTEALNDSLGAKVEERTRELAEAADAQKALTAEVEKSNRELVAASEASARDMAMAVAVQRGFLPVYPPSESEWDLAVEYRPVSGVSGDFYDFYVENGRFEGLAIGDVSGHGIASGLISVLSRSVFERRFHESRGEPLSVFLERANEELQEELAAVDNYLTCLVVRPAGERLEYVNAAHTEPIFRRAGSRTASVLAPKGADDYKGPPLGLEDIASTARQLSFRMGPGDILLVYTDGLVEGKNARGELYGMERLLASVGRAPERKISARVVLEGIMADFDAWTDPSKVADDLTAIVLVRK